jgi:hypothetical protein
MMRIFFVLFRASLFGLLIFVISAGPAALSAAGENVSQRPEEQQPKRQRPKEPQQHTEEQHQEQEYSEAPQQTEDQEPEEQRPEEPQQPEDWQRRLEMLRSVPYLGYARTADEDSLRGVVFHDPERAWAGYNFYSTWATGEAFLIDMDGTAVHRWTFWPEQRKNPDYAFLLPEGDLLVIHEYAQLKRIDWDSRILWQKTMRAHHDARLAPDGTLWVIVRSLKTYRGHRVWFDDLVHLDRQGEELNRWSTFGHLEALRRSLDTRSFLDTALDSLSAGTVNRPADSTPGKASDAEADRNEQVPPVMENDRSPKSSRTRLPAGERRELDYFHVNTVTLLPETPLGRTDDRFRAGYLLICLRNVNQIAVLDPESGRIVWAWGEGQLEWPHHPTMLADGRILLFDNGVRRGFSRVVEMDPVSKKIVWQYRADPPEEFYSYGRGSAQRLPNRNTLICESDRGRVFEVTPGGETVWTWWNPLMKGGRHGTVYRMIRRPAGAIEPLLNDRSADESH